MEGRPHAGYKTVLVDLPSPDEAHVIQGLLARMAFKEFSRRRARLGGLGILSLVRSLEWQCVAAEVAVLGVESSGSAVLSFGARDAARFMLPAFMIQALLLCCPELLPRRLLWRPKRPLDWHGLHVQEARKSVFCYWHVMRCSEPVASFFFQDLAKRVCRMMPGCQSCHSSAGHRGPEA